jgi:hypothetical protein
MRGRLRAFVAAVLGWQRRLVDATLARPDPPHATAPWLPDHSQQPIVRRARQHRRGLPTRPR